MKASFEWIRSLVPELRASPEELAARFTAAGLEVEAVHAYGAGIDPCVVAEVISVRPHPTKSGLRLVTVDRGGARPEVVCGAPNVPDPGGLVVLAPLETHLPAKGVTIASRIIGGIVSEGMLCSEQELGLDGGSAARSGQHDEGGAGILVLPDGCAAPGTPLIKAVSAARDTIFEIGLMPNRPDGLGHLGLAREAAALYGIAFRPTGHPAPKEEVVGNFDALVRIRIEDAERCPHYGAAAVLDVRTGPSPLAVRYRLAALGVRSISNVVDVTNLMMLLYGHPMHAFDLDQVRGAAIVVRRATKGESLTSLDGVDRTLSEDDLVICDADGPIALAGVIGGARSEIGKATRRVLLECAYFEPRGVRRASRRHGLHTESSHRFERGVDHGDTRAALAHAAALVAELAGGSVVAPSKIVLGKPLERQHVRFRSARLDKLLGVRVPWREASEILGRLGFESNEPMPGELDVLVPSHRPDVTREVHLIEEVARVRGLEAIPMTLPAIRPVLAAERAPETCEAMVRRTRAAAVHLGLSETLIYGFVSARSLETMRAPVAAVNLKNPLSENQSVMRTSLLPGLADALARAVRHGERNVRIFATGSLFLPSAARSLPDERLAFAAILAGERPSYLARPELVDVWEAKGVAVGMLERLTGRTPSIIKAEPLHLHPRGAGLLEIEGERVGLFGPLHPDIIETLELPSETIVVELDLAAIAAAGQRSPKFAPLPRFPPSTRDVALVVKTDIRAGDVEGAVRDAAGELAEEVRLFDRFVGGSIPAEHASLAFHVVYRSHERTLTDAEVDAIHAKVIADVHARFGATLRA